jgi:hypothetical protein
MIDRMSRVKDVISIAPGQSRGQERAELVEQGSQPNRHDVTNIKL